MKICFIVKYSPQTINTNIKHTETKFDQKMDEDMEAAGNSRPGTGGDDCFRACRQIHPGIIRLFGRFL